MKTYLFDTMVLSTIVIKKRPPETWFYKWEEIREGRAYLLLFESLIAELFYQLIKRKQEKIVCENILRIKRLPSSRIIQLDDNLAFKAGKFRYQFQEISTVDAFSMAIVERNKGMIFTTDHSLRDAAKEINIKVSYLPKEDL